MEKYDKLESIYETLFKIIPYAVLILENGEIVDCNQTAICMFGYENKDDIIGVEPFKLSPTIQPNGLISDEKGKAQIQYALSNGNHKFEWVHKKSDGSVFFSEVILSKLFTEGSNTICAIIRDVTEWKIMQNKIKESENKYRSLFEKSNAVMILIDPETKDIVDANDAACVYYGYTKEKLTSLKITAINVSKKEDLYVQMESAKNKKTNYFCFKHRLSSGEIRDVEVYGGLIEINSKKLLYSIVHDITEKVMFEQRLMIQKSYFKQLFENSPDAIAILDNEGKVISINLAFKDLFQYDLDEIKGKLITNIICIEGNHEEDMNCTRIVQSGKIIRKETIRKDKQGNLIDVNLLSYPIIYNDKQIGIYSIYTDIRERKKYEEKIQTLAYTDSLTGLYNRAYFIDRLNYEINKKENKNIGIMFLDLDGFKKINDTLGHVVGDNVLKSFADRIKKYVRKEDIIARMGGDEFIILLPNVEKNEEIIDIAKKIVQNLENIFVIEEHNLYLTTSIGISTYPSDGTDAHTLIKNADIAMYKAKENIHSKIEVYSHRASSELKEKFIIDNDIRSAISKNELYICYQPIVDVMKKKIIGAEALLRWNHSELGSISPSEFIPIAEKNGCINSIGNWVIENVCRQNKLWQDLGYKNIFVSVNVSVRQLEEKDFVEKIKSILKSTNLDPRYLEIEITESAYMENIDNIISELKKLKDIGVGISIDDFGTGYSSLSQLSRLNIDKLKIDKSFVDNIENNDTNIKIVGAIIMVAKSLNIDVIAEGVENKRQLSILKKQRCKKVQGYVFSRPLTPDEFEKRLIRQ
ncbi:bifunctional diguanylate cyclase/phosphodiesterase [Alkalithermobacter paradoxus]|uniref:Cyclic di-GMP phosphodiesterase Gmr n=1 Tax=Alkalithermobacter paradoxus TaxID=29349 RepID=A0A1V4I4R1_9FIRM|nr:cyclic di-GMP phosphodiesterase Gmr [[Clostridium] thermoalcaliphilum]